MMFLYSKIIVGTVSRFHGLPIWRIILVAVSQAVSFASTGSKLEPDLKNKRVNVIKINVKRIFQDWYTQLMVLSVKSLKIKLKYNPTKMRPPQTARMAKKKKKKCLERIIKVVVIANMSIAL